VARRSHFVGLLAAEAVDLALALVQEDVAPAVVAGSKARQNFLAQEHRPMVAVAEEGQNDGERGASVGMLEVKRGPSLQVEGQDCQAAEAGRGVGRGTQEVGMEL